MRGGVVPVPPAVCPPRRAHDREQEADPPCLRLESQPVVRRPVVPRVPVVARLARPPGGDDVPVEVYAEDLRAKLAELRERPLSFGEHASIVGNTELQRR